MKNTKFLIVGGGIAGLYILKKLVADNNTEIVLLESTHNIGGRIKTAYTADNNVKYETGVHNNHKNMLKLVKNLNLRMHQTTSSEINTQKKNLDICYKSHIKNNKFGKIPGLSYWDVSTLKQNICKANIDDSLSNIFLSKFILLPCKLFHVEKVHKTRNII